MKPVKQEKLMFKVPANKEGRNFLTNLRKNLNTDSYSIWTKYTGPRPRGTSQHSTSKENATFIRIYVESKREEDNIQPYEYIAKGREIERDQLGQEAFKSVLQLQHLEKQNRVLETRLSLITAGLKDSSKYGHFIETVNRITELKYPEHETKIAPLSIYEL